MTSTRNALIIWGKGSTDGEYLAADILRLEGYTLIDPIHPQGGRDGKKDIVCFLDTVKFVVACWFPNNSNQESFNALVKKFETDLEGVALNQAKGFVFFTNCEVTDSERNALVEKAIGNGCSLCHIYHIERIRTALDSPLGYGTRLRVLDIEMSKEDQLSYHAAVRSRDTHLLLQKMQSMEEKILGVVGAKLDEIKAALSSADKSGQVFTPTTQSKGVVHE